MSEEATAEIAELKATVAALQAALEAQSRRTGFLSLLVAGTLMITQDLDLADRTVIEIVLAIHERDGTSGELLNSLLERSDEMMKKRVDLFEHLHRLSGAHSVEDIQNLLRRFDPDDFSVRDFAKESEGSE